jgi:hypothetical protein
MNQEKEAFPVVRVDELARSEPETEWLLDKLWAAGSVGIVGGPAKCGKTWLALDMAVSLASGTPCLGLYHPTRRGRVLLYAAEDSQSILKQRIEAICRHRKLSLNNLEIFAITADRLRLDLASHQKRLTHTVEQLNPDLLLLDPLVRLHRIDENNAGEVSTLLDYLRTLQRQHNLAITLVHHTRKNCSSTHPGQALRGSSDLHAWVDAGLYLRRKNDHLMLLVEHRAAPSPSPVQLCLAGGDNPHLEIVNFETESSGDLCNDILLLLQKSGNPVTRTGMRQQLKTRNERLGKALAQLEQQHLAERTPDGWRLLDKQESKLIVPVPPIRDQRERNGSKDP